MRLGLIALAALCLAPPASAETADDGQLAEAAIPSGRAWFCYEAKTKDGAPDVECYRSRWQCFDNKTVAEANGHELSYPLCAERASASVVTYFQNKWIARALPTPSHCEVFRGSISKNGASKISTCKPVGERGLGNLEKKTLKQLSGRWRCIDSVSEYSSIRSGAKLWAIARGGCFRDNGYVTANAQCEARKKYMATQLREQYKARAAASGSRVAEAPERWVNERLAKKTCHDVVTGVFAFSYDLADGNGLFAYQTAPECEYARGMSETANPSRCEYLSYAAEREKELAKVAKANRDLLKVQLSAAICWAKDQLRAEKLPAGAKTRLNKLIDEDKLGLKRAGARKRSCRRVKTSIACYEALVDESARLRDKCVGLAWFDAFTPAEIGALGVRLRKALGGEQIPEHLTTQDITRGLRKVRGRVANCGARYRFEGKIKITMVIAPEGTVEDLLVSGADDKVHACVAKFVKRARFAKARNKTAVKYPLILR